MSDDHFGGLDNQILFLRACLAGNENKIEDMRYLIGLMDPDAVFAAASQTIVDVASVCAKDTNEIRDRLVAVGARMENDRLRDHPAWMGDGFPPQQQTNLDLAFALQNVTILGNVGPTYTLGLDVHADNMTDLGCSFVYAISILGVDSFGSAYIQAFTKFLNIYTVQTVA